ncbi:23S rRNA (cytidine1920-2'-O)/16S rRNA (cytidine1409-2'-O)-methyltransferase [Frankineae bacterium MT45]|nr:23S rRNA (cytidine1920-2'-O)/16S rRNA (cytidine1409-2'-O)-methyltransferase [Frankineae bacterium MT45]
MAARRLLRLDAELVRRGLARSREQASELISAGRVEVRGVAATKAATAIDHDTPLRVLADETDPSFASRGAYKLVGALRDFGIDAAGRRCLDAGASTGGFTDVLLRDGAASVAAVDVGYGQLAWALRTDERVTVYDRINVRTLTPEEIGGPASLTVADLSFISLRLVLAALINCTEPDGDLVPMVKPQFEVGRERLGRGGVVRDPVLHSDAVFGVAEAAAALGWGVAGVTRSSLPGPSGNVEFFLWLRRSASIAGAAVDRAAIDEAVTRLQPQPEQSVGTESVSGAAVEDS